MASSFQSFWRRAVSAGVATVDSAQAKDLSTDISGSGVSSECGPSVGRRRNDGAAKRSVRHIGGRWVQISYALIDLFFVCIDSIVAFWVRFFGDSPKSIMYWHRTSTTLDLGASHYTAFLLLYAVVILLFCQSQDLYRTVRTRTATQEFLAVFKAILFATLLVSAFIYFSGVKIVSRLVVGYAGALNVVMLSAWRLWKRKIVIRRAAKGVGTRNVVIVGAGRVGQALAEHLEENKLLGYCFKGFLDANHNTHPRLLGKIGDLSRVAQTEFVDEVFISIPSERELVKTVAAEARRHRLGVKVVPDLYDGLGWNAPISHVGSFPVMELHWEPIPTVGLFFKRVIDVMGSVLGLTVLSPILVVIGMGVQLDSRGPAIYSSPRVGKKGRKFVCYKFRTMVMNADVVKHGLRHLNEREGPTFKITNDPRITSFGKLLRKYSLDELPQLWNVLKGDMSLVGPRPHPMDDYEQYQLEHLRRLDVKPGITGLWQVTARKHPSFDTNMQLDLDYIENWNLWLDLKILSSTLPAVLSGSGS
jgi:exopolysaccharide biosynthesis polyprenyl glycosylphosphotransferase